MKIGDISRLVRLQFTPLIAAPVALGGALAWHATGRFPWPFFALTILGSVCLHLAANSIDDVHDYSSGTDKVSERAFPQDAPGWKPIARGKVSIEEATAVSFTFYGISLLTAVYLSLAVGWFALAIAVPAILISYFYTAPPLRLDYQGLGLGELSVFFSFGPIPALGAYYVCTGSLSTIPVLVAATSGLLTTGVLVSHDLIYYDVYRESGKHSLTVVLGRRRATIFSTALPVAAYSLLILLVAAGKVAPLGLVSLATFPLLLKFASVGRREMDPPSYGARTRLVFVHSVLFTLLLAGGIILS